MVEPTPEWIATSITSYAVLLFSLSFHESAHGWMALQMGDDTALREGRITLNPASHIDPIGTVLMPVAAMVWGDIPFLAWAKPTPVGAHNFRKLARGHLLVAGAGPVSNLILMAVFAAVLWGATAFGATYQENRPLLEVLFRGIWTNIGLAVFNLVPLPPLDGSWIASWGLPRSMAHHYDAVMEPYGQWILLLLVVTKTIGVITAPIVIWLHDLVFGLIF